jgi:hypothetical protein
LIPISTKEAGEARPASTWLERYALPIALSVMEAQPVALLVALLTLITAGTLTAQPLSVGVIVLLALGLLWWSMFVESVLRRTRRSGLARLLHLLGWLAAFSGAGSQYALLLSHGATYAALFLDALVVTWFWRQGMRRAQAGCTYGQLITSFKTGFGVLLAVLLLVIALPQQTALRDALAGATPVYFISGLIGISLARLGALRGGSSAQSGPQSDPTRPWLVALAAMSIALLLVILLIEVIFPFHAFVALFTALNPLWNALGTLIGWLLYAMIVLLWPIYLLIDFLAHLGGHGGQQQGQQNQSYKPPTFPQRGPQDIPPELLTVARVLLIALALLTVILLIRALLNRRLRGEDGEEIDEVREGLDARSLLGKRWRAWWNRRRKSSHVVGLEQLDPDSARARYREVLLATAGGDLQRQPNETPHEYQARLLTYLIDAPVGLRHLAPEDTAPATPSLLEELTGAYSDERYGGKQTDERKRMRLRTWVPRLVTRLAGRTEYDR